MASVSGNEEYLKKIKSGKIKPSFADKYPYARCEECGAECKECRKKYELTR